MSADALSQTTEFPAAAAVSPALAAFQRDAWERFKAAPLPAADSEQWRFASPERPDLSRFHPAQLAPATPRSATAAGDASDLFATTAAAGKIRFDNDHISAAENTTAAGTGAGAELPAGVVFGDFRSVAAARPDLLAPARFTDAADIPLGSAKLLELSHALLAAGAVVHVPDNTEVALPFVIANRLAGDGAAIFPHTLVIAGANARVRLVEHNHGGGRSLAVGSTIIVAGAGARVSRVCVQDYGEHAQAFHFDHVFAARGAEITSVSLQLGARRSRHESIVRLRGEGADARLYSAAAATGGREIDQRTLQVHESAGARSDLLFKNALFDRAKTIFSGLIQVAQGAQKTDAYQTNRNLLLSPAARADSLPGLEIGANDVRCSHGATNSQLDAGELFYLLARGIPPAVAQELLVFGFFEEILEKVGDDALAEDLRKIIRHRLGTRAAGGADGSAGVPPVA
ncbi:MAG: Fe-S cluster assembly protein SufD [Puniceicoccales bacterium]|jgi:Fe-S cluster assembly protein SufD|nr:Fe-S cluster assembly protein SufD [Puniceicoccales bacterium]